jgi:transcriptional regulator with XRE-family HTH domain
MQDRRVLATGDTLDVIKAAIRQKRIELGLSMEAANDRAGLQDNYWHKIECGLRRLGYISLPCCLGALGLELLVVEKSKNGS